MNTFSTVGSVRRSNGCTALGAALLVLAASVTLVDASVIDKDYRWGGNPLGAPDGPTTINICYTEISDTFNFTPSGVFYSRPGIEQVVAHIRDAVNASWAYPSAIRFEGWQRCPEFGDTSQYVAMLISSRIQPRIAGFGPANLLGSYNHGHLGCVDIVNLDPYPGQTWTGNCRYSSNMGASCTMDADCPNGFCEFSGIAQNTLTGCSTSEDNCTDDPPVGCGGRWIPAGINLQPWGTTYDQPFECVDLIDGYSFDCVEQYAVHLFGLALGALHEMAHPARPAQAPGCAESDVPITTWSTFYDPSNFEPYVVVRPDFYDTNSVMAFGSGCADVTGKRFGSPRADAYDVQGMVEVYGPPPSPNFYSDISEWRSLLVNSGYTVRQFLTTATNVALANQVAAPPTANMSVGSPLTFLATTAGVPFSFTLDALQPGAGMVYWDQSLPGWNGTLSIGDVDPSGCDDCYANDDFELSFDPTAGIYGVGFYLVDNNYEAGEKLYVYGASGLLRECGGGTDTCVILPTDSGAAGAFIGVIADEPITSLRFDENTGGDDIAIRDLQFAYVPQVRIAYPDLPAAPVAIGAGTMCTGSPGPLQRTIHVPDDFVVGNAEFAVNADHSYRGDIQIVLRSPSGTEVTIVQACSNCSVEPGLDVRLDDTGFSTVHNGAVDNTAAPYFVRDSQPSAPLSAFVGERAGGDWIVKVCDANSAQNNGTYNRSQLILEPQPLTVASTLATLDPTDGVTTLREAMAVANATNGTITFDPSLAGQEIPISTAAFDASGAPLESAFLVDSAVLIDGAAAPGLILVISGSSPLRHFGVNASGHLTLRNLTLSNGTGSSGGAIEVRGDAAGATAKAVRGYLSVENSTFEYNSAMSLGGAIRVVTGTAVLTNTTVAINGAAAGGGALFCGSESDCRVLSSTFSFNSGGGINFYNVNSLLLLENSIVANNNGADLTGSPVSGASHHNLVGDPASAGGLIEGANNNLVGDGNGGVLPGFLNYGDNGGPTSTALPLGTARGIDAGQTFLPFDQRGAPREALADIGAVEIPRYEVSTTVDDGAGSLREAVARALAFHGGTIDILTSEPIVLTTSSVGESAFEIDAAVTIEGNGATILRDPNAPGFRLFDVVSPGSLTLRDLTLIGGVASDGGVIRSRSGLLTVEHSTVADGSASNNGGGIYSDGLSLVESTIRGNFAGAWGGGIYNAGQAHVTNSTIVDNFGGNGGGIASSQFATLFLNNSTLSGNQSANGGALFTDAATVTVDSSTIVGNTAANLGGGILKINDGTMLLRNSVVAGNTRFGVEQDIEYVLGSGVSAASHHNLISTPAGAGGLIHGVNSNILGDGAGGVLPLATILNPSLAYNGGLTWTHDLVSTSPARDAGLTVLQTDQRGVSRPQGSTYDIGAVEYLLIPTQIIVAVQTLPGGDPTLFSFVGDAPGTIADGQSIFATVTPGTYGVAEDSGAIVDKIAFVTSGGYSGDLVTEANGLGLGPFSPSLPGEGLLAADAICNYHAQNAAMPLSGTYTAWLSDSSTDARDRLAPVGPWVRTDGAPVAADVTDLITCSPDCLANPIDKDENGVLRPPLFGGATGAQIMTGTQADGTVAGYKCLDWTSSVDGGGTGNVLVGLHSAMGPTWTILGNTSCAPLRPIYCFGDVGGSILGPPAGWDLVSIACDDADSTGDLLTASAAFQVALAESVTCTFTNALPGLCTLNTDGDASFDCADNDDDNDGVPDASDPDPLNPTVCGLDADADGCDDCSVGVDGLGPLADADPANDGIDTDADGICDATDCAPGDPGNSGALGPVFGLVFTSQDDFQWSAPLLDGGGSLVYDVLRSTTAADFGGAACAETAITAQTAFDPTPPPPGGGSYYLIRVQAACGGGHLGFGADASQRRSGASCP